MKFTIYHLSDGRVLQQVDCPPELAALQCPPGAAALAGETDPASHYIANGQRQSRPVLALPDSLAAQSGVEISIDSLPMPADVEIDGVGRWHVDTGHLRLTFDTAGNYCLHIDAFPAMRHAIQIEVT